MVRDENGKFMPGSGGRPAGSRNKFSSLKDDLMEAYLAAGKDEVGGVTYLRAVKRRFPGLFLRVLARLLPREIAIDMKETPEQLWRELQEVTKAMDRVTIPGPPGGDGGSRPRLPRMGRMTIPGPTPDVPDGDNGGSASNEHVRGNDDLDTGDIPGG